MIQLQDQKNGTGDRERPGNQSESIASLNGCEQAKAKEDDYEPQDQGDQQWLRNRRNRLRLHQSANLGELHHQSRRLRLKSALRLIVRFKTTHRQVNGIPHLLVGIEADWPASLRRPGPPDSVGDSIPKGMARVHCLRSVKLSTRSSKATLAAICITWLRAVSKEPLAELISSPKSMAVIVATSPSASFMASLDSALSCSSGRTRARRPPRNVTPTRITNTMTETRVMIMSWLPLRYHIVDMRWGILDFKRNKRRDPFDSSIMPKRKSIHCATSGCATQGSPTRISFEKSGESFAARARVSIRLRALSSANGRPPVIKPPSRYNNSSPLPLSKMRQSHGILSLLGCWLRMLVVQLVVMALYQRGLVRSALSERTYSRNRSRTRAGGAVRR